MLIDRDGAVWQGNFGFAGTNCATPDKVLELSHSVSKYDKDGNALSPDNMPGVPGGYPGDGNIFGPQGMSSDPDNGNIWISNCRNNIEEGNQVTLLVGGDQNDAESFAPFDFTGYSFAGLVRNTGVSIDPSGNVWLTNNWLQDPIQTNPGGREVVVFLGLAKPVKTPMVGYPDNTMP